VMQGVQSDRVLSCPIPWRTLWNWKRRP